MKRIGTWKLVKNLDKEGRSNRRVLRVSLWIIFSSIVFWTRDDVNCFYATKFYVPSTLENILIKNTLNPFDCQSVENIILSHILDHGMDSMNCFVQTV